MALILALGLLLDCGVACAQQDRSPEWRFVDPGKKISQIPVDWSCEIGNDLGPLTLADGKLFGGTNLRDPTDRLSSGPGVLFCLDEPTGKRLWRAIDSGIRSPTLPGHVGVRSRPALQGANLWYVNTLGQLVCLDVNGFRDGVNDGTVRDEDRTGQEDADYRLRIDLLERFRVFPANDSDLGNPGPAPLILGNTLFVNTGNGCSFLNSGLEAGFVSRANAPAIVAIDVRNGDSIWSSAAPGLRTLYGWASPILLTLPDTRHVVLPGADGCLYGFEGQTGKRLWTHDFNPPEATPWNLQVSGSQGFFYSDPAIIENQFYGCLAQDVNAGFASYPIKRIDIVAEGTGIVARPIWSVDCSEFGSSRSTPAITKDHAWVVFENTGTVVALDRKTGKVAFSHVGDKGESRIHAAPFLVGRYLYAIFHKQVLIYDTVALRYVGELRTASQDPITGVPFEANGHLYVGTRGRLERMPLKDNLPGG